MAEWEPSPMYENDPERLREVDRDLMFALGIAKEHIMNGPRVIGSPAASLAGPAGDGKDVAPGHCVVRLRQVGVMHTSPRM